MTDIVPDGEAAPAEVLPPQMASDLARLGLV